MLLTTHLQREVLRFIAANPFATDKDLKRADEITASGPRQQALRLVEHKLLRAHTNADGVRTYSITDEGRAAMAVKKKSANKSVHEGAQVFGVVKSTPAGEAPKYAPYVPLHVVSVRPGADDHLLYKSRGM